MIGLVVLAFLIGYIAVAITLTGLAKGKWKLLVIAVFALIPTWDIIPGKIALAHYCEKEGGIRIYRAVNGVDGFLSLDGRAYGEYLKRDGYRFLEIAREKRDPRTGKSLVTEYVRITLGNNGNLLEEKIGGPVSRYAFRDYRNFDTHMSPWGITEFSASIIERDTGETISTDKRFGWYGGWVRRFGHPILGSGGGCPGADDTYSSILLRTLVPARGIRQVDHNG